MYGRQHRPSVEKSHLWQPSPSASRNRVRRYAQPDARNNGCISGALLVGDKNYPAWFCWLAIVGGAPTAVAGIVMTFEGFSNLEMAINMPANLILISWVAIVGILAWPRDR